jgi:hypothetical protein
MTLHLKIKIMHKLFTLAFILTAWYASAQIIEPDLNKRTDLENLGYGKIIQKDNCVLKKIILLEVKENGIVFIKDGSIHDMDLQSIKLIEFPESKWKLIYIRFINNVPEISWPETMQQ